MKNNKNKQLILSIMGVAILLTALVGVTYAFFNYTKTGNNNTVQAGRIVFNSEQTDTIELTNAFPITRTMAASDTTNTDEVVIAISGDTTYSGGVEYLVTATDVSNTVGNKTVPISIVATASSLGNADEDYFANRGVNASSSIYKVLSEGTLSEGDELLVGYIKQGATGVNGTLTIKAFLDSDLIAISDTYNGTDTPTDSMGTTSTWVNGRTVFTTSEWNSLSVSFKVKVEAQEGVWVEEPVTNVGTIDSCPNCKFIYTTNSLWTTWNAAGQTPTELTSGYSTNYNDIVSSSGKNYFLGVITNESNRITRAFACGLKDNTTPFCIEGTSDGSKYSANSEFLNGPTFWNDACTVDTVVDDTMCGSWDNSGAIFADGS